MIHTSLKRTVNPAIEPVSLVEAKANAKVDTSYDNDEFERLIQEAREGLEDATGRAFITQTWVLSLDAFPRVGMSDTYRPDSRTIELRVCPVQSVSSITYLDPAGEVQTLPTSVYTVDTKSEPGRISLKNGQTWPTTLVQANAVTVTFLAGYGDAQDDVPALPKRAIKMRVAHWYNYKGIATDARAKAGERAWDSLVKAIDWGGWP